MALRIRRTLATIGVLTFLCTVFASGGTAFAASPSTVNFAPLQKTCAILQVHLNGIHYTTTCLRPRSTTNPNAKISPDLGRSDCSSIFQNIKIWNYNYTGELCFDGGGYLGVQIYQVNDVYNVSADVIPLQESMWIRYYQPGTYCTIQPGYDKDFGSGYTNIEVTQLDWGASNGGNC
jgi:hypothetical protein